MPHVKPRPVPVIVIPTTHWDRDWYWPFERFRVRLIELFQVVKELWRRYPGYRFAIDGQSIPVEDYLEAVPHDRALLAKMGRAGRFTMGPLYVQPDLYCTGGEAFVRNLLIGTEMARGLHALQRVVYLPDSFGHTASMPMLVRGFGFSTYAFMRGLPNGFPDHLRFFRWKCPDGSAVNVVRLRDGYANAARLGLHRGTGEIFDKKSSGISPRFNRDMAKEQLRKAIAKQVDGQGEPHVLLAGVDHQIPQTELADIMRRCSGPGTALRFGDWNEVEQALQRRPDRGWFEYSGEFHGIGASSILGGTVSTRIYLKQANADAERLLGTMAEPAEAAVALLGTDEPAGGVIQTAWKRLLKVHPHDDITGCSVDAVHRENEGHIACAIQAADAVRRRMGHHLIQRFGGQRPDDDRYAFFVYGTSGRTGRTAVTVKVDYEGRLDWGDIRPFPCYDIVDENGRPVPFRELERKRSIEHPHPVVMLEVHPELQPFAFQRFFVEKRTAWPKTRVAGSMENERLRVTPNPDGSIDIADKRTGARWPRLGIFSDQADCGDEYTFSHIKGDREIVFVNVRMRRTSAAGCNGLQVAGFEGGLRIPAESTPEDRSSGTTMVPVSVEYSLAPGATAVGCRIRFANTAQDHRLRWNLELPFAPRVTRAGIHFNEVLRSCGKPVVSNGHVIDPEHPTGWYVAVEKGRAGLALFPSFPVNYEVVHGRRVRLAVTILRSVGFLSRSDMLTRGGGAGPDTLTPDAQCLRSFDMEFAIRPYDARTERDLLFTEAIHRRSVPVTGLILGFEPAIRDVDHSPLLAVEGRSIVVSALKRTHDRTGVVLRLFNAGPKSSLAMVRCDKAHRLVPAGLDERPLRMPALRPERGAFRIRMTPYSLASFLIE